MSPPTPPAAPSVAPKDGRSPRVADGNDDAAEVEYRGRNIIPGAFLRPDRYANSGGFLRDAGASQPPAVSRASGAQNPPVQMPVPLPADNDVEVLSAPPTVFAIQKVFNSNYGVLDISPAKSDVLALARYHTELSMAPQRSSRRLIAPFIDFLMDFIRDHATGDVDPYSDTRGRAFRDASIYIDDMGDDELRTATEAFENEPDHDDCADNTAHVLMKAHIFWAVLLREFVQRRRHH